MLKGREEAKVSLQLKGCSVPLVIGAIKIKLLEDSISHANRYWCGFREGGTLTYCW